MHVTNTVPRSDLASPVSELKYPSFKYQKSTLLVLQKEVPAVPTAEMHQQVPTSSAAVSAPNSTVSHTGRSEFKHRLTHMSEKILPFSISATMKPRPPSLFLPTVRKPLSSQVTTFNTGIGGTTQKKPGLRSTSSFRRSVELATGDNWIVPTSNSVSNKQLYYIVCPTKK
jgi:hypothetical protein